MHKIRILELLRKKIEEDQKRQQELAIKLELSKMLRHLVTGTIHYPSCLDNLPPTESIFE